MPTPAPGSPAESSTPNTKRPALFGCLIVLAAIAGIGGVIALVVFTLGAGGETVARIAVADAPASATFDLTASKAVTLWTDLDVKHAGFDQRTANKNLPHVLDYEVVVTHDGTALPGLRCNPFDSDFARTSGQTGGIGDQGRSYDGRLEGCAFDAPPGRYVVTARRQWHARDPRLEFRKTDLLVRAK